MNVLDHNLVITGQQLHRVLPKIREVVALKFVDDLRNLNLYLIMLETDDLEILIGLGLDIKDFSIARVLLPDLVLDIIE
jgi:hypothetical protein